MGPDYLRKPVVLVFAEKLLPISETFIAAQTRYLSTFTPRLIGLGRVAPSLPIPSDSILLTRAINRGAVIGQKVYRRLGLAPLFHSSAAATMPTLIHAHFANGGMAALPLVRNLGVPLVVTLHGSDVTTQVNFQRRYRDVWRVASSFICVSEFIKKRALEAGFPENKLKVHYIGVDRHLFNPPVNPRDPGLLLFVGRLVEKKGCATLLRSLAKVKSRHSGVKAVIVGDGPLRPALEKLGQELGVSCQFVGSQPAPVVRDYISKAKILCAPSLTASNGDSEGAPISILEAQATGLPVVSTHHAGIPELVADGETGLLAPERDVETLAQHITRFIEDDFFWRKCSESAVARVKKLFDLESQTRLLEEIYLDVCGLDISADGVLDRFAS